jgi:hypothetical protein
MADVVAGFFGAHAGHGVAQPDALIECGQDA